MSVIVARALPGRARRAEAGPPARPLRDARGRPPAEPPAPEVRARRRRRDGLVPPARRRGDLRHARPHGAAVLDALPARRRARATSATSTTTRRPRCGTASRLDTRVATPHGTLQDRGPRRVARHRTPSARRPSKCSTALGEPVSVSKVFHSGEHPTLRLRTREGFELTGTHNHPVLCLVDMVGVPLLLWKLLDEIDAGRPRRARRTEPRRSSRIMESPSRIAQLALLLGAFVAEGWVGARTRAGFNNVDQEFFDAGRLAAYDAVVGGPRYVYERTITSGQRSVRARRPAARSRS